MDCVFWSYCLSDEDIDLWKNEIPIAILRDDFINRKKKGTSTIIHIDKLGLNWNVNFQLFWWAKLAHPDCKVKNIVILSHENEYYF